MPSPPSRRFRWISSKSLSVLADNHVTLNASIQPAFTTGATCPWCSACGAVKSFADEDNLVCISCTSLLPSLQYSSCESTLALGEVANHSLSYSRQHPVPYLLKVSLPRHATRGPCWDSDSPLTVRARHGTPRRPRTCLDTQVAPRHWQPPVCTSNPSRRLPKVSTTNNIFRQPRPARKTKIRVSDNLSSLSFFFFRSFVRRGLAKQTLKPTSYATRHINVAELV